MFTSTTRRIATAAILVTVAGLLAGCGNTTEAKPDSGETPESITPQIKSLAEASPASLTFGECVFTLDPKSISVSEEDRGERIAASVEASYSSDPESSHGESFDMVRVMRWEIPTDSESKATFASSWVVPEGAADGLRAACPKAPVR